MRVFVPAASSVVLACAVLAGCAGVAPSAPASGGSASRASEVTGKGAVASIIENFDRGPPELPLNRRVDTWGDRIRETSADIAIVDTGATGKAAQFVFRASFDSSFSLPAWQDSGLVFVGTVDLPAPGPGTQGIAFRMKPDGFALAMLSLVQDTGGTYRAVRLPLFASDGAWKDWRIPYSAFRAADPGPSVDFSRPLRLEVEIPLQENWNAYHFRTAARAEAALFLDSLGFWRSTSKDEGRILETFDDERDRMPFTVDLYGSGIWTDYSKTDAGETRVNDGVTAQRLALTREPGGDEGDFLTLTGRLGLTPSIAEFHKAGQALTVFLKAPIGVPAGSRAISFLVRSDTATAGTLEVLDVENDLFYDAGFPVLRSWTRVRIPFNSLRAGDQSLAEAKEVSAGTLVQLAFELPTAVVERAAAAGTLGFSISLDSIVLEP